VDDSLAPDAVEPLLTGRFGRTYRYVESCGSTQELLERDDPEGAVAVCDEQTEGRGRSGREWYAPPGSSMLLSMLLRPPHGRRFAELSLVAGMATADAVEEALVLAAQIKWPNDVMVNRKKVAGVLAEARDETVILGIGINVNQDHDELPKDARVRPASLYTTDGIRRERAPVAATVIDRLELHYERWREGGLDAIYDFLGARDFLRGRHVSIDGASGTAIGIARDGRLEIEVEGDHRFVESGEVTYVR
jgi:BirA family transcriptional regulator, biotin operon repressor / biotin---[acetyl-CoA-carboxylase] ligase